MSRFITLAPARQHADDGTKIYVNNIYKFTIKESDCLNKDEEGGLCTRIFQWKFPFNGKLFCTLIRDTTFVHYNTVINVGQVSYVLQVMHSFYIHIKFMWAINLCIISTWRRGKSVLILLDVTNYNENIFFLMHSDCYLSCWFMFFKK